MMNTALTKAAMKKALVTPLVAAGMIIGTVMGTAAPALADDAADDEKGVTCIDIVRMKSSKVIDNQTIIIDMRGGPDYKMTLANRCPGLKMQDTWIHDARSLAKLCDVDVIRVPVTTTGNVLNTQTTPCIIESLTVYDDDAKAADKAAKEGS